MGIGINTGIAYVGSVNAEGGVSDISMLGDSVNTTARLTSLAAAGEMLISENQRERPLIYNLMEWSHAICS